MPYEDVFLKWDVEFFWKMVAFLLLVGSVYGVVWGYYVYWVGSDLCFIVWDLWTFNFQLRDWKLVSLYLCPAVYILISVCLFMRVAGMHREHGGWADELFIVGSGFTSTLSIFIFFYILTVWGKYVFDLFHAAFAPYCVVLMYMALCHTKTEDRGKWFVLGVVLAIIWVTFIAYFNYRFGWDFPKPV